jgi:hypothetical protein
MLLDWPLERRIAVIILMIAAFIYAVLLGALLAYETQKEQDKVLRQQTIAKCLDAGGHIGPGARATCGHENPSNKRELMP